MATSIATMSSSNANAASSASSIAGPSSSSADVKKLAITSNLISAFKPAKVFTQYVRKGTSVTSASFDDTGFYCLTSGEDDYIHIYDVKHGVHSAKQPSQKYGCHLARFTHDSDSIIYASTKENNVIRYCDIKTHSFRSYFAATTTRW